MFFFEKKNQKTFFTSVRGLPQPAGTDFAPQEQKFFGSFFQKRTASLLPIANPRPGRPRPEPGKQIIFNKNLDKLAFSSLLLA
jgi:hypothetical protein